MQQKRDQAVCINMLYLVGITLFIDKSATCIDVAYLIYLRDLELVSNYAWGAASLAHLYMELNNGSHYKK